MQNSKDDPRSRRLDLRRALREGTAENHERLDARFAAILDHLDGDAYARFIAMNHACHEAIEPVVAASPLLDLLPDWPQWSRLPQLRLDLESMQVVELQVPEFPLRQLDLPQAIGVSYVVEGSRLGATLIHRRIEEAIAGDSRLKARRYLQGARDGDRFLELMRAASTLEWSPARTTRAVEAARATFDFYARVADLSGQPLS
ncbi:biliverdin-producing heme oxygenase [Aureimonas mangrovi]|uniref:biliverdin-producing heme oxygenase n=1 Tax=Aureimonas mangrovi TaxID=2758041 RepID=UPI00163DCF50|nr:biliverdin-producing heme oxygenase [Aureimonas mangrovi]